MANALVSANDWYELADGEALMQGDIIRDCPKYVVEAGESETAEQHIDAIIMSQSCDIDDSAGRKPKAKNVLMCPVYFRDQLAAEGQWLDPGAWEQVRKRQRIGFDVLSASTIPDHAFDYVLVDLRDVFTVSYSLLREVVSTNPARVRLRSPYREHLAQNFAWTYMRVGLPTDLPSFKS